MRSSRKFLIVWCDSRQALLSMLYLTVSDIFALINYVGFATWVSRPQLRRSDTVFL